MTVPVVHANMSIKFNISGQNGTTLSTLWQRKYLLMDTAKNKNATTEFMVGLETLIFILIIFERSPSSMLV